MSQLLRSQKELIKKYFLLICSLIRKEFLVLWDYDLISTVSYEFNIFPLFQSFTIQLACNRRRLTFHRQLAVWGIRERIDWLNYFIRFNFSWWEFFSSLRVEIDFFSLNEIFYCSGLCGMHEWEIHRSMLMSQLRW